MFGQRGMLAKIGIIIVAVIFTASIVIFALGGIFSPRNEEQAPQGPEEVKFVNIDSVLLVPQEDIEVMAGTERGVYVLVEGEWKLASSQLEGASVSRLQLSHADGEEPPAVFAVGGVLAGVIMSPDMGENWIPSSQGLPEKTSVAALGENPQTGELFAFIDQEGIYRSSDNAQTWQPFVDPPEDAYVASLAAVSFEEGKTRLLAGTNYGIYMLENPTGEQGTWQPGEEQLGEEMIWELDVHPTRPNLVVAATTDGLYRSEDGGLSWQKITSQKWESVKAVDLGPDGERWAVVSGDNSVFITEDEGETWSLLSKGY